MAVPSGSTPRELFDREVNRERGIIAQSNARSASISQLLSAVWAATGIVAVYILSKPNVHMTDASVVFGVLSGLAFAVQLLAKAAILWPRGLSNLPHDKNEAAYQRRLTEMTQAVRESPELPIDGEYREGFLLQQIRTTKERYTQVVLAAIAVFLPCIVMFFVTLSY